jgi:hypothetical protein
LRKIINKRTKQINILSEQITVKTKQEIEKIPSGAVQTNEIEFGFIFEASKSVGAFGGVVDGPFGDGPDFIYIFLCKNYVILCISKLNFL